MDEGAHGGTCAQSVRRPPERYGHVVALTLEARIVAYEVTTSRDQDSCPQSLDVMTRCEAYIALGAEGVGGKTEEIVKTESHSHRATKRRDRERVI